MGLRVRDADQRRRLRAAVAGAEPYALQELRLHLTRRCNLRCVMCAGGGAGPEPDAATWRGIIRQALPLGLRTVKLFGGEPLLVAGCAALVADAANAGCRTTVTTNGTLLDAARAAALTAAGLSELRVSLDAPAAAVHDAVRGVAGAWAQTVAGVAAMRDARGAAAAPRLHLNAVVQRRNIRLLPQFPALCRRLGVDSLSLTPVSVRTADAAARELLPTAADIAWYRDEGMAAVRAQGAANGLTLTDDDLSLFADPAAAAAGDYAGHLLKQMTCLRPWYHLTVDAALAVYACKRIGNAELQPLGLLTDTPLHEIWTGSRSRAFRQRCRDGVFADCRSCCLPTLRQQAEQSRRLLH